GANACFALLVHRRFSAVRGLVTLLASNTIKTQLRRPHSHDHQLPHGAVRPQYQRYAMSLYSKLQQRQAQNKPVRVALIGAGKFGSMYLAQIPRTPGVHLVAIADLSPDAARRNLARVGWQPERTQAASARQALAEGSTWITDDWRAVVTLEQVDVVV